MSALSGINLAMLPKEEHDFLTYLATTGDIWACSHFDDTGQFEYEPQVASEFLRRFSKRLRRQNEVRVYLGHRDAVLKPRIRSVSELVGGKRVRRRCIDEYASPFLCYQHGLIARNGVLTRTNLYYHTAFVKGNKWIEKAAEFSTWARKVLAWMRRRATDMVPVEEKYNDAIRATPLAAEAVRAGLKVI